MTLTDAFVRLGALAGVEPAALKARLPKVGKAESDAFRAMLAAVEPQLKPLAAELSGSLLGRLLGGEPFDGEPNTSHLPKEAKKALKKGQIVACADADLWIFHEQPDGSVQVSHAHPEGFGVLGESIAEWLTSEADAIAAKRQPKKKPSKAKAAEGKPAIDAVLARLVELSGGGDARDRLAAVPHPRNDHRWKYLKSALKAVGTPWSPAVLAPLEGRLLGRLLTGSLHDNDDETAEVEEGETDLDGINPVYVKRYPKAAWKLIADVKPTNFVASSGSEIWFILWEAKGAPMSWPISVHHASYDGYEQIAPTLEAWLAAELERVERALG